MTQLQVTHVYVISITNHMMLIKQGVEMT